MSDTQSPAYRALLDELAFRLGARGGAEETLAMVLRVVRAEQWQPIETAPRDNHARMVWCPEAMNIYIVTWWQQENAWAHFGGAGRILMEAPTHWMPLPSPPSIRALATAAPEGGE
jgi:hypothetical protein